MTAVPKLCGRVTKLSFRSREVREVTHSETVTSRERVRHASSRRRCFVSILPLLISDGAGLGGGSAALCPTVQNVEQSLLSDSTTCLSFSVLPRRTSTSSLPGCRWSTCRLGQGTPRSLVGRHPCNTDWIWWEFQARVTRRQRECVCWHRVPVQGDRKRLCKQYPQWSQWGCLDADPAGRSACRRVHWRAWASLRFRLRPRKLREQCPQWSQWDRLDVPQNEVLVGTSTDELGRLWDSDFDYRLRVGDRKLRTWRS